MSDIMTNDQRRLRTRVAVFACIAVVALVLDQISKAWAQSALADGQTVRVIPGILSFTLVHNPGASLGMGSNMTWLISLLAIVACVALAVLAIRTISMKWTVVFALAFAGALGNLIDRVMYAEGFLNGKVVDFLNYGWSVGNVADIFLMVAGVAAVVLLFVGEPFSQKDLDEQAAEQTKQTTGDALVGKRFDVAVAKMLGISRAKAAELIESGQARVLGRDISKSSTLQSGETVEFDIVEERTEPEPIARDMAVVYEDDDVIVVDKPVGVAAHASVGWTGPTVLGSLLDRGVHITSYGAAGRQGIVSRLDVGTSGLMLVCKSDLAYVEMRRQFAEHEVVKTYHALVQGNLKENKATIEAPIGRAKVSDFRFCVTPAGKEAITHWDVMERFGEATLVSVNLETGRTHQIRVHFSSIGHPLAGDAMYGANPQLGEALGLERQWLHAKQLEFRHPRTHVWTTVKSHYPADLQHALDVMRGRHDTQDKPEV